MPTELPRTQVSVLASGVWILLTHLLDGDRKCVIVQPKLKSIHYAWMLLGLVVHVTVTWSTWLSRVCPGKAEVMFIADQSGLNI